MELTSKNNYYTPYEYKKVAEKLFVRNEPDYRTVKNLLSGKKYAIIAYGSMEETYCCPQYNTPDTESRLTDGVLAERATFEDPAWVRFSRGVARSVIFDIGGIASVSEFCIRLLKEKATAVRLPNNVDFAVSETGVDFETVAMLDDLHSDRESEVVIARAKLEPAVRARFVRVTFCCPVHVYIDQIEAIGKKDITGARAVVPDLLNETTYPGKYCGAEQLGGAKDVLLAYFCHEERAPLPVLFTFSASGH